MKNKKQGKEQVYQTSLKFKFEFADRKTYKELYACLDGLKKYLKEIEKCGAKIAFSDCDFYQLEGTNPKLQKLGFEIPEEDEEEEGYTEEEVTPEEEK